MKIDAEKIAALAAEVALEEGVEVVDLEAGAEGPRAVIRVFLDREGGIRLSDCESFSRKFGALLDVADPVPGPYALEVSSPGIDRRLVTPAHFAAAAGRRIRVSLREPVSGSRNFKGTLLRSDADGLDLERDGRTYRLPLALIRRANVDVSQDELFGPKKTKRTR